MEKEIKVVSMYLVMAAIFVCGLELGARATQEQTVKIGKYEAGEQLVMTVNSVKPDGSIVVLVKEVIPVLTFKDAKGQHSALPSPRENKICRELYEYKDSEGIPRLAFICGTDTFITTDIALFPKSTVKKNVVGMEEK